MGVTPVSKMPRVRRLHRLSATLLLTAFVCIHSPLAVREVGAVETSFSHFFRYENSKQTATDEDDDDDDDRRTNMTRPSPSPTPKQTRRSAGSIHNDNYGSLANMVRWNTFSIVPDFGMETGARVEIEIRNLSYVSFPAVFSSEQVPVVFTLYDIEQWRAYAVLRLRDMPLKSPTILCHYPAAMRYTLTERAFDARQKASADGTLRVAFDIQKPSLYTLQVQVCGDASVFVSGRAKLVNRGFDNQLSEHLAVEELGLLALYKAMVVIYSVFALLWILLGFFHRKTTSKLGHVFQLALHFKTFEAFVKLWYYREFSVYGQRDSILKTTRDVAESAASAVLLCVMLLAALGWSLTRDHLSLREWRFMVVSFLFYLLIAIVKATCPSDDDDICKAYMLTEYLIKSVMMLGVIVALNFTISQLRLALTETRWNNYVSPLMYMKLNQFQNFRYVFLSYLIVPTSLLILNLTVVTPTAYWRYDWVNYMLNECSSLVIFVCVALNLLPIDTYIFSHASPFVLDVVGAGLFA